MIKTNSKSTDLNKLVVLGSAIASVPMLTKNKPSIFIFLLIAMMSCNSQKKIISEEQSPERQVEEILGTKFDCLNNKTNEYRLCYANKIVQRVKYISFVVYDIKSSTLVYNQARVRGVQWDSDYGIRVDNFTGMPKNEGTNDYYIYDVQKKEKSSQ